MRFAICVTRLYHTRMATKLVPLPDVEKISPSVIRILGGNPGKVSIEMNKRCIRNVDRI